MLEAGRIIGIGSAYVEGKIESDNLHLPLEKDQLPAFLDTHPEADLYAGGSIPNILTSCARVSGNPNIRLLSCVGNDRRGRFYIEHMDPHLGEPFISRRKPTDIWVGIYNNRLVEGMDFYGAISDLEVPKEELHSYRNDLLITDIDTCRIPEASYQLGRVLATIEDHGLFILSLTGANPNEDIDQLLSFADKTPHLVFGNSSELSYITSQRDLEEAVKTASPNTKLLVTTQAEKGAVIRFNGQLFSVPARYVPEENVIDETGAGDVYMGTMLAFLLRKDFRDWNESDVMSAAKIASLASALVIQTMHSRLTTEMAQLTLEYAQNLNL
ncbi:carbohydrate kinase family protein [Candidatus Daviesbacteria bacterium]|nr:carbohydrate kinase family protein [Candidatus Daviesbacteria bacterium]